MESTGMKIVQASEKKWSGNLLRHRQGRILIKRLLEGDPDSPENYGLQLGRESAEFFSPRHRHPWDQIRFCLSGSVPIAPGKTLDAGEIGYFPEGVRYGPQKGPVDRKVMIIQFGGASGKGYLDRDRVNRAYDELSEYGTFKGGVFRRARGDGPKNQDGYEAIWRHVTGRRLIYPDPRYNEPIIMKPKHFTWRPADATGALQCKALGSFSERGTRVALYKLSPGRRHTLPNDQDMRVAFVVKGKGKCGRKPYGRHSAMEFSPTEAARFTPETGTQIVSITIPSVT